MKTFFATLLLISGFSLSAQSSQINLTQDMLLTETLVITENTVISGNGFAIRCDGCSPAIEVKGDVKVVFNDVMFPNSYAKWLSLNGNGEVSWNSSRMQGFIRLSEPNN